jgi:hypothetical protein
MADDMYSHKSRISFWAAAIIIWAIFVTFFNLDINASFLIVGVTPSVFNCFFVLIGSIS